MSQRSFWNNWFKPATGSTARKWTLEELKELYDVLLRNGVVTESNRAVVVETIRTIAEYILWGDQNEPRIFDFFLENNILTYLHKVLLQPSNRTGEVAKQVLQTLSIIIQNVRSETGIFFLFSNNHINNIVDLDFDFSDEEVLGYYISFLKTISLKLNAGTVHFFLNSSATGRRFPLYSRAVVLAHNREGMVRAAVRTLTLHVYSVDDADIQRHVTSPPAAAYFGEIGQYLAEQVQLLDWHLSAAEAGGSQALASLDSQLAEVEDVLSYASDLLSLGVPPIAQLVAEGMWQWVVWPLLLKPLLQPGAASAPAAPLSRHGSGAAVGAAGSPVAAAGAHFRHLSWGSGSWQPGAQAAPACVRPVCAVYVLERVFQLVAYPPLLTQLLLALACPNCRSAGGGSSSSSNPSTADGGSSGGNSASVRSCLLDMLTLGHAYPAVLVLRLLVAALNNRHAPAELLAALGVLPRKHHASNSGDGGEQGDVALLVQAVAAQLQAAAVPAGPEAQQQQQQPNGLLAGTAAVAQRSGAPDDVLGVLTQQYVPNHAQPGQQQDGAAAVRAALRLTSGGGSGGPDSLQALELMLQRAQQRQQQEHNGDAVFATFGAQLLPRLMQLLQLPSLPPYGLWLLGWLLHQLLPVAAVAGAAAAGQQQQDGSEPAALDDASLPGGGHSRASSSLGGASGGSSPAVGARSGGPSRESSGAAAAAGLDEDDGASVGADSAGPPPPISTRRAASVQSNLSYEPRASVLSAQQQAQLQQVLEAAHAGFGAQLSSMWCEAVFPLLALEWPAAREMLLRPVLRAGSHALLSGTAVWPLLQALQAQHQQQQDRAVRAAAAAAGRGAEGLSMSASSALECYLAVQRVVALTQVQELLRVGAIACAPPVPTVSEADLKQVDIQEGYQVDLAPGSALPCVVSFAPGQERRVYFAVAGLSRKQLAALQGHQPQGAPVAELAGAPGGVSADCSTAAAEAAAAAANHATLLRSLPVAVLADPSPNRPQAGVVLSVAPLLGARPYTDSQVPKWLHVHVRPSVRGLLRIIKTATAKKGGLLAAMRQLADGHWVLAFSAADKAALAVTLAQQHSLRLQALYAEALAPLAQQQPSQPQQPTDAEQQQGSVADPAGVEQVAAGMEAASLNA